MSVTHSKGIQARHSSPYVLRWLARGSAIACGKVIAWSSRSTRIWRTVVVTSTRACTERQPIGLPHWPGVLGFVTRGSGISVHRLDCSNTASLQTEPERLIPVEWAPNAKSSFLVAIQVEALDRNRLLSDITRSLSDQHVNILSAALTTSKDRICRAKFTFETADPTHLDHVLRAVRSVPAVYEAYRIISSRCSATARRGSCCEPAYFVVTRRR